MEINIFLKLFDSYNKYHIISQKKCLKKGEGYKYRVTDYTFPVIIEEDFGGL